MSTRYKFVDNSAVYFTTSTVAGWTDVFTREMYKTIGSTGFSVERHLNLHEKRGLR